MRGRAGGGGGGRAGGRKEGTEGRKEKRKKKPIQDIKNLNKYQSFYGNRSKTGPELNRTDLKSKKKKKEKQTKADPN